MGYAVLLLIAVLYGLCNYYVGNRIAALLQPIFPFEIAWFVYIPFLFLASSSLAAFLFPSKNLKLIGTVGNYWLAVVLLAFVLFGLTDTVLAVIGYIRKTELSKSVLSIARMTAAAAALVLLFIGIHTASDIKITKYEITIDKQASPGSLKIVMFSDLHLGYVNDHEKLLEIVSKINRANPDLVVISGDFFDGNYNAVQEPQQVIEALLQIEATYGTYLAWGNHDAGDTFDKMRELVAASNITILEDKAVKIVDSFLLVGRKDSSPIGAQGERRVSMENELAQLDAGLPVIVLDHQPSNIGEYEQADLILCGHTHQGQVFPINFITDRLFAVDYGYYRDGNTQVIVSSGIATWGPPIRLGTKSELVEITVRFGAERNSSD